MADLLELRGKLDEIDAKIVDLYENRMDICKEIAEYKIQTGKKVFDRQRENEKLTKVRSMAHDDFTIYLFDRRNELPDSYSIYDMAKDTASAIKALGLKDICLFGASQGGQTASAQTVTPITIRAAATIATMAPIIALYPFLQRYFVTGLTIGGVKE